MDCNQNGCSLPPGVHCCSSHRCHEAEPRRSLRLTRSGNVDSAAYCKVGGTTRPNQDGSLPPLVEDAASFSTSHHKYTLNFPVQATGFNSIARIKCFKYFDSFPINTCKLGRSSAIYSAATRWRSPWSRSTEGGASERGNVCALEQTLLPNAAGGGRAHEPQ